jgi:hypothetical protein
LDFHFYIFSIGYSIFYIFLCTQEQQRAPSVPISLICGDGDATANPISGGDVPVSEADQQGNDMGTQVFSNASSIFSFKLWQTPMSKTFYLTCVYLNYIQGSKSSTQIVVYSESQSFTRFPEQEFNREDWNAKADAIHNMGDDSTPIGSRQESSGDAERAPSDGDDAQRSSPADGAHADGGPNHPEVVLPNVMGEGDVNAKIKTITGVVGEVAVEVEKNPGANQQVQHLSHFLFISVISYFLYLSHFLHCPCIRFLKVVLVTLQSNPVRQGTVLP